METSTAEMRHRLKNSYAMIGSLLAGFARGVPERETFAQEMIERLSALGRAQTLFAAREHAPCELADLLPALVSAFDKPDCPVTIDALPAVEVDQGRADAIALVLGELAVNSTKHGALGGVGSVHVIAAAAGRELSIVWRERSNRAVIEHSRSGGQGFRLMERIVRARRGTFSIDWYVDGLDVRLAFALDQALIDPG